MNREDDGFFHSEMDSKTPAAQAIADNWQSEMWKVTVSLWSLCIVVVLLLLVVREGGGVEFG